MNDTVKCVDCGLLSLVNRQTQTVELCTLRCRTTGSVRNGDHSTAFESSPICGVGKIDIPKLLGDNNSEVQILDFIKKDRFCKSFVALNPCLTPKEHLEMDIRDKLMEREDARDWWANVWNVSGFAINLLIVGILSPLLAAYFQWSLSKGGPPATEGKPAIVEPQPIQGILPGRPSVPEPTATK